MIGVTRRLLALISFGTFILAGSGKRQPTTVAVGALYPSPLRLAGFTIPILLVARIHADLPSRQSETHL